jgi:hypothetical protein
MCIVAAVFFIAAYQAFAYKAEHGPLFIVIGSIVFY